MPEEFEPTEDEITEPPEETEADEAEFQPSATMPPVTMPSATEPPKRYMDAITGLELKPEEVESDIEEMDGEEAEQLPTVRLGAEKTGVDTMEDFERRFGGNVKPEFAKTIRRTTTFPHSKRLHQIGIMTSGWYMD